MTGSSALVSAREHRLALKQIKDARAAANLEQAQPGVDVDRVFISKITVDDGPRLRRGRPASKWVRMHRILKRMSHITVELAVKE